LTRLVCFALALAPLKTRTISLRSAQLIKATVKNGREVKSDLKIGVCGEHGGDPRSVAFFAESGLNYVSCSPFRVPIARLAAAHFVVEAKKAKAKAKAAAMRKE